MSKPAKNPTLSQINVFPVKSIAGISQSHAWVEQQGLSFDRRFMVARPDGSMITARKHPQLVKVSAALLPHGLVLNYPEQPSLKLQYSDFAMTESEATVWSDTFNAYLTTEEANKWFSQIIGEPVHLLFTGEQSQRLRAKISQNVSFADGYPMLIISEASLDALNERSPHQHTMDQFRTNLVVSGTEPFAKMAGNGFELEKWSLNP